MQLSDFDYPLPEHLIAQEPAPVRDASRLLVLGRQSGCVKHHHFHELPALLTPGDLLVLNDTRVVAARLVGHRAATGGKWEGLFVREVPAGLPDRITAGGQWELLIQTRGHLREGEVLLAEGPNGVLALHLEQRLPSGRWLARPGASAPFPHVLAIHGQVPIPPYIRKGHAEASDEDRYQTIFAARPGAIAAPTAGLHFTPELFRRLEERGVDRVFVTLHVGPGTFQPVKATDIRQHRVEPEWGELPAATALAIQRCRQKGGRIIAVGTTTVRVLETAAEQGLDRLAASGWQGLTTLTICPPYVFRLVDALITNFHLPRSSLLLLVSAFAGREAVLSAYQEAVAQAYRFYSYGDAMLILPEAPPT